MLVRNGLQVRGELDQRSGLFRVRQVVRVQVFDQIVHLSPQHVQAFAHQILTDRFQLARLDEHVIRRVKATDDIAYRTFLPVDRPKAREHATLLLFDLLQVVLLRQELHSPRIGTRPVRAFGTGIAIRQLNRESKCVPNGEVGQRFVVVPIDLLFASVARRRL